MFNVSFDTEFWEWNFGYAVRKMVVQYEKSYVTIISHFNCILVNSFETLRSELEILHSV